MADEKDFRMRSNQEYDIQVQIKDKVYTTEFTSCIIMSSINTPYILINLVLTIDQNDITLNELYGHDEIILSIDLYDKDNLLKEKQKFSLMALETRGERSPQNQNAVGPGQQPGYRRLEIPTVMRKEYKGMNTLVNEYYENKTIKQVIEDLVSKTKLDIFIDSEGLNNEVIDQIIIPPMTLYKSIKYLDNLFGIFNGACSVFTSDNNTVIIKNISYRIRSADTTIIIHPLVISDTESDNMLKEFGTSSRDFADIYEFITFVPIKVNNSGNLKVSNLSLNRNYIVKPKDTLYHKIETNTQDICEKNGLNFDNMGGFVYFDKEITDRTKYITDHMGYEKTNTFILSDISRRTGGTMNVSTEISTNIILYPFLNVGDNVIILPRTLQQEDLRGRYILRSSILNLVRKNTDVVCYANMDLIRTTNGINQI